MRKLLIFAAFLSLAGTSIASAQQMEMPGNGPASSPADEAFAAGMSKMSDGMARAPMTSNADKDFVGMMIPHHQGAVSMAETELKYGKDPELKSLARDIVAAQDKEIAEMRRWQAAHEH
jgi:uncharacterized protein (DUF305 family)